MSSSKDVRGEVFIPLEVKTQIDYLHSKCKNKEWSGILVYKKVSGDFQQKEAFRFEVLGIYPMNIGSHAYTEYDYGNHIAKIYDVFDDLENVRTGMIHSHHNMSAFFSGVDMDELKTNCKNHNLYLSLIVNFDEKYVAKAAIPSKTSVIRNYEILDDKGDKLTFTDEKVESDIFILDLDVEIENKNFSIDNWFEERFEEIEEEYSNPKSKYPVNSGYYGYGYGNTYNSSPQRVQTKPTVQRELFDDDYRRDWDDDWGGPVYNKFGEKVKESFDDSKIDKTEDVKEEFATEYIALARDFLNFLTEGSAETLEQAIIDTLKANSDSNIKESDMIVTITESLEKAWDINFGETKAPMLDEDIYTLYVVIEETQLELMESGKIPSISSEYTDGELSLLAEIQDLLYFSFLEGIESSINDGV